MAPTEPLGLDALEVAPPASRGTISAMPTPPVRLLRRTAKAAQRVLADPTSYGLDRGRPPTDHPRVGLVGFYGWGNFGDELFLEALSSSLGPTVDLEPLIGPSWRSVPSLRRGVLESDVVVIGGGDLLRPWAMTRYWRPILLHRPVFVAGLGVPMWGGSRPVIVDRLRTFFGHPNLRGIATRDAGSAAWIRENLEPKVPVRVTPDLVCSLDLPGVQRPVDPPIFGVAVRRRDTPDDLTQVRRLCERAVSMGYRLRRIILGTGKVRENDLEATMGLGFHDTELISSNDLEDVSRAIGECTVLATMKFHGVVVATMYGVTPIAMMPTSKTRNFIADIGRRDLLTSFSAADLPDHLLPEMQPVEQTVRDRLRNGATEYLRDLRADVLCTAARGYDPGASGQRG
jgi:polysaccharide pyruvyl transferase WcaK-like protein